MLSVTPGKNCCIIQSMISKLRSEDIERVTKRERAICRPECYKMILNSERVKTSLSFTSYKDHCLLQSYNGDLWKNGYRSGP